MPHALNVDSAIDSPPEVRMDFPTATSKNGIFATNVGAGALSHSLTIGFTAVLILVLVELLTVLFLNNGHFIYTLDDPYIHLRLAENILRGHYGVNPGEYSSPSSSILWPFLLAPFAGTPFGVYIPLLINIGVTCGTVILYDRILRYSLSSVNPPMREKILPLLLVLLVVGTNLIGLIFLGMEHALQVFLTTWIVCGIIQEAETGTPPLSLPIVIALAPTVRYENLAVSAAALVYLFLRHHRRKAVFTGIAMALPLLCFSFFLTHVGLAPLPNSVTVKTDSAFSPFYVVLAKNLQQSISLRGGLLLTLLLLLFLVITFLSKNSCRRIFAGSMAGAVILHLLVGKFGWYDRYEIYIWSAALLSGIYLLRHQITTELNRRDFRPLAVIAVSATIIVAYNYAFDLATLPVSANNIYEQQYQMHRFVVELYRKPVAVNDIGYVGYQNPSYVMDLFGLSSSEAMYKRLTRHDAEWLNEVCEKHHVRAAIVYDVLFKKIPKNWRKVGELGLSRPGIIVGSDRLSFYALDDATYNELHAELLKFSETLPEGTSLGIDNYVPSSAKP